MPAPDLSFVIAAYNDADGVMRHLDWFARAGRRAEVIVVDDASTDDLRARLAAARLPEAVTLRHHRLAENRGPGPARNEGLRLARGAQLMFLDADDLLVDGFFDWIALSPLMQGADFVLFKHHLCRTPGARFTYDMHLRDNRFFTRYAPAGLLDRGVNALEQPGALGIINFPWNKVYRTAFLREAGIVFPDLRMHEDIRPHWQSVLRARRFAVMGWAPPLVHHFEIEAGGRATNYMGPERCAAFETLREVAGEIAAHPQADRFWPVLIEFAEDLRDWMQRSDPDRAALYAGAAETLFAAIRDAGGDVDAGGPDG